jgi:hypothetical protein
MSQLALLYESLAEYVRNKGSRNLDTELGIKRNQWTQAKILANKAKGTIWMAVNGIEMLYYTDDNPSRLRKGPIGLQAHAGNLDVRYKDIYVEVPPQEDKLITLKKQERHSGRLAAWKEPAPTGGKFRRIKSL